MSISGRLRNASSIAILLGDVSPFMFNVAILMEAIRFTAEGVGEGGGSAMVFICLPFWIGTLSFSSS